MKRTEHFFKLMMAICLLVANATFAQQLPSKEVRAKLQLIYNGIKNPEISFERFVQANVHVYSSQTNPVNALPNAGPITFALASDTYCGKVRPYCTDGDFEAGLDQNQYTGAYGLWVTSGLQNLYPDPFALTYGFVSGPLNSASAHQTIVNKASGKDTTTGISVVPLNGGNQSLRLGNTVNGYGTELIAKTVVVNPSETILNFYYAVVFEDPGHPRQDQPAFSVRVYDCATGLELPNVCDLGNGSNIAVSDARNPFFTSLNSGTIAYRDWSLAQINLSQYVGKTVVIVFTNKDCGQGGHWGYTYLDNLFSSQCLVPPVGPVNQGTITFDTATSSTCGTGKICAKYTLPNITSSGVTTTGSIAIDLNIYQNGAFVKKITSPVLINGSSYCFNIDPGTLGILSLMTGFDYSLTGNFILLGSNLASIVVGNPPNGIYAGQNNDYTFSCSTNPLPPPVVVVDTTGKCPAPMLIKADPLTCMAKISWTAPSRMFPDSISVMSGANLASAHLIYKGTYNGHGYYESTDKYRWMAARDAASAVGGHLITITSMAENNFVGSDIMEHSNYAWIGLYNTGTVGSFAWVTGEPLNFTNWIPGEPNNFYNDKSDPTVYEHFVHINGYDSLSRWNDLGDSVNATFIAEFDSSIYTYRQISGPANGDSVKPGMYNICYERTNTLTGIRDSCCFNITVTCNSVTSGCQNDTTITADPLTCMARVTWTLPSSLYPDSIPVKSGSSGIQGMLKYKGTFNGHGYYESTDKYSWTDSRDAVAGVGGHLVTITSLAENGFVGSNINEMSNYAWIGLYNTGTVGSFAWITGEPLNFTNWIPGEPNNLYNLPGGSTVYEPYVHINGYDSLSRWNDLGAASNLQFIAEFDSSVIKYRQISGPTYGDSLKAGTYTICYQKTNPFTQTSDTCCFNITVVCNNPTTPLNVISLQSAGISEADRRVFNAVAYPNPTSSGFKVKIISDNSKDKITMKVVDITGRMIDVKNSIVPGNTVDFGSHYTPGIYFTTITQGSKTINLKLVKQ